MLKALDKRTAQDKAVEKAKKEEHDHRNLFLAKVYLQFISHILSYIHKSKRIRAIGRWLSRGIFIFPFARWDIILTSTLILGVISSQEGLITEEMPAAAGVSAGDMAKRKK